MIKNKTVILTGAPFSGKTTLLKYFKKKGYKIIEESARFLINYNRRNNINILPWIDQDKFERLCFKHQLQKEKIIDTLKTDKPVIMDESVIDFAAYYLIRGLKIPSYLQKGIDKSNHNYIFILEVLPNYKKDKNRPWTIEQIKDLQQNLINLYSNHYPANKIHKIPALSVEKRFKLIEKIIS